LFRIDQFSFCQIEARPSDFIFKFGLTTFCGAFNFRFWNAVVFGNPAENFLGLRR